MCGIFGITGSKETSDDLLRALKRLEYRGYDSAGIATLHEGSLVRRRATGPVHQLEQLVELEPVGGAIGIAHTRWATHGPPTVSNAHPHATSRVAVVHNGIIENAGELRAALEERGVRFQSDTDTEVIPKLMSEALERGQSPIDALRETVAKLRGSYAIALMMRDDAETILVARNHSPISVAAWAGGAGVASDASALSDHTSSVTDLKDGDMAVLTPQGLALFGRDGRPVERAERSIALAGAGTELVDYPHYTAKEIHEQPSVAHRLVESFVTKAGHMELGVDWSFAKLDRLRIVACGSSFYAGLVARHWFETHAGLPVDVELASEFQCRLTPKGVVGTIVISQSGETADTLNALKLAKEHGPTLALVNVEASTIGRLADASISLRAGPERGVASTKAFCAQLMSMAALSVVAGRERGELEKDQEDRLTEAFERLPAVLRRTLELEPSLIPIAEAIAKRPSAMYLGRGAFHALSYEGALKLKEISYVHAEGFAAGELKHGPLALVEEGTPIVVCAPPDETFAKTMTSISETMARGAHVTVLTHGDQPRSYPEGAEVISMPLCDNPWAPIAYTLPLQLLAYHCAVHRGLDVDRPRNLAKCVTVE